MAKAEDYAIVRASGRQHRVAVGDRLRVDSLPQEPGSSIDLDQVLLLSKGGEIHIGTPLLQGAKVKAKVA
ncbi:MAG: 50S ribosomal protein L21, partial [Dehalococcoidia bacterium]